MKKFGAVLTNEQMRLCRQLDDANITTLSQAVKAFQREETAKIEAWQKELKEKENGKNINH